MPLPTLNYTTIFEDEDEEDEEDERVDGVDKSEAPDLPYPVIHHPKLEGGKMC